MPSGQHKEWQVYIRNIFNCYNSPIWNYDRYVVFYGTAIELQPFIIYLVYSLTIAEIISHTQSAQC